MVLRGQAEVISVAIRLIWFIFVGRWWLAREGGGRGAGGVGEGGHSDQSQWGLVCSADLCTVNRFSAWALNDFLIR